jgi:hypothetical protein
VTVLFHEWLVNREFGSHLLSVAKLNAWAQGKGLELVTLPPVGDFLFVQAEALLCAIESAVQPSESVAIAVVKSSPALMADQVAQQEPRFALKGDAALAWRELVGQAVRDGELSLLDYGSKLPIQAATARHISTVPAPVVVEANRPLPVATGDIANAFAGLHGWSEAQWKKPLGDKPKWLADCIVIPGAKGVSERRWNPVLIGAALVRGGHAKVNSVRSKFQTSPQLDQWRDEWKTYEADNFATE